MKRLYDAVLKEHLLEHRQMVFMSGPRQVGKTTLAKSAQAFTKNFAYYNWDDAGDREKILGGSRLLLENFSLDKITGQKPIIAIDEIHKFKKWKNFVKGMYDHYADDLRMIITGSARLNVYRKGGDSLMGRYFLYRIHPLSVGELVNIGLRESPLSDPKKIDNKTYEALFEFGGFPEPFLKQNKRFLKKWQGLRHQQLLREDINDISQVMEISQLEVMSVLLSRQVGQLCTYSNLAKKIRVSDTTIRRWIAVLEELYYCFTIRPLTKNVTRSLLKEPKVYLWDWSKVEDSGARVENFVAAHLLKAVHYWTDTGLGKYDLFFIRDKDKREVDFLVTEEGKPWMLIEVKSSEDAPLNSNLVNFQQQLRPQYTFQVAYDMPYVDFDIRTLSGIKIVPLRTFLSQLV